MKYSFMRDKGELDSPSLCIKPFDVAQLWRGVCLDEAPCKTNSNITIVTTTREKSIEFEFRGLCEDADESPKAKTGSSVTYLDLGFVHILGLE
jgi:hypothetical protein